MTLMPYDKPGFWEGLGYHMYGDPWQEQRYSGTVMWAPKKRMALQDETATARTIVLDGSGLAGACRGSARRCPPDLSRWVFGGSFLLDSLGSER